MLLVAEKGREDEVLRIFEKWGLDSSIIGIVTADDTMRVTHHGELVCEIPNKALTDDAPVYHRPVGTWKAPVPLDPPTWVLEELKKPRDYTADLKKLLASANICSKHWIFEQYDSMVQTNTVQGPGGEAGVMRIKGTGSARKPGIVEKIAEFVAASTPEGEAALESDATNLGAPHLASEMWDSTVAKPERGLAMALAGNGRWTYLDPKLGAMHAVAEAARKVACTGATPVAATNCHNSGNPEKPEIMAQLSAAIDGIAEACTALGTPVTGGNVSLYNETKGEGIYPTPVIGVVGILDDVTKAVPSGFQREGEVVALLVPASKPHSEIDTQDDAQRALEGFESRTSRRLGSSEFAKTVLRSVWGVPPHIHVEGDAKLNEFLQLLITSGWLTAAKDISDGGVAVALAQMTFPNKIGATVNKGGLDAVSGLFGEDVSDVIVTFDASRLQEIRILAQPFGVWVNSIGKTGGNRLSISMSSQQLVDEPIASLHAGWSTALESQLAAEVLA